MKKDLYSLKSLHFVCKILLLCVSMLVLASNTFADTHYMPSGCANLQACFSAMSSGDTLEIADGTYTTSGDRFVGCSPWPPSGPGTAGGRTGDDRFTIIKAANPGMVVIGNNSQDVFSVNGRSYGCGALPTYLKFDGIIFKGDSVGVYVNNGESGDFSTGDLSSAMNLYWYFKGCGFNETNGSANGTINFSYTRYTLLEDCFSWGRARYGQNTYLNDYLVVRRHVDRRDASQGISSQCPAAGYMNYASRHFEYQNIIEIDTDGLNWGSYAGGYGNIYVRNSYNGRVSYNTRYRGAIVLNSATGEYNCVGGQFSGMFVQSDPSGTALYNTIFWNNGGGIWFYGVGGILDHVTVGKRNSNTDSNTTAIGSNSSLVVTNSNCYDSTLSLSTMSGSSAYNNDYNCSGSFSGSNITTTNTTYQYLMKPESSFPTGNDGQKKGAKVLYKYGVDGTFYGETGYADAQTEVEANKLWPWGRVYTGDNSWEKVIWSHMRLDSNPSTETRGFCGSSQSITNWVATGAGTITPTYALTVDGAGGTSLSDVDTYIYGEAGGDTTPPTISNVNSDKTNGQYKVGEIIDIDVTFSEAVTSTGDVTVTLETGTIDRTCTFNVSNSTTGTCNYTVQAGDTSSDLNTNSISGTIRDQASNAMVNFTPTTNLAANKALVIDTTDPSVNISTSDPSSIISDSLTATGTVSDTNTITSCRYLIGSAPTSSTGTACGSTAWSCAVSGFARGPNTLYVGCFDTAGNVGTDYMTVYFNSLYPVTGLTIK